VETMSAVAGRPPEVTPALPRPGEGTPEAQPRVAATANRREVDSPHAMGAPPVSNLMDKGRARDCAKGERALAFLTRSFHTSF